MKIRFLSNTHIRRSPDTSQSPVGYVYEGSEIEVLPRVIPGMDVRGNNHWYKDSQKNWYYWSGRTEIVEPDPGQPVEPTPPDYPDYPVFERMTSMLDEEDIPPGETRSVPPFETLQMIEEGFQTALTEARRNTGTTEEAQPIERRLQPEPIPPQRVLNTGPAQALNWGVTQHRLKEDWWETRQLTGAGIRVALLSTGANHQHPDLSNIVTHYTHAGSSPEDINGLGTQAAVVCAGTGQQLYGVAPQAQLLIGKIGAQDHSIRPEGLIEGLKWAIEAEADIIAMLVDFPVLKPGEIEQLNALVKQARAADIFLLAPVGTSENKKPENRYPARLQDVFSVGAHREQGERCSFSARSYQLDLLAPGEGLQTSGPDASIVQNTKSVSIATAYTAGFAALVCQYLKQQNRNNRATAISNLLQETVNKDKLLNAAKNVDYGYGLLYPQAVLKNLN
ncbi:MAG: S8 family serine peptidase [Bacteroidetes bacterium]|jgi:subtilisin family serine protease|nr:S8 family serine peptidase [Bacteroidota bacterium]